MMTRTNTYTYTKTRIGVIDDHFRMFLTCSNMEDDEIQKLLRAADNREISAVGIYIEQEGYMVAEVEFEVDWDEHRRMVGTFGEMFDTNIGGWKNGVSPEAYISAQQLVDAARHLECPVRSWVRLSPDISRNPVRGRRVCDELGYSYNSAPPGWKAPPVSRTRTISRLPEAKVTSRVKGSG